LSASYLWADRREARPGRGLTLLGDKNLYTRVGVEDLREVLAPLPPP